MENKLIEHKFKGEVAYAVLCPHCDESILCRLINTDEPDTSGIIAHIYPTREDADIAVKELVAEINDENYHDPIVVMVNISPIEIKFGEVAGVDNAAAEVVE